MSEEIKAQVVEDENPSAAEKEDRKDERTKIQATQQSELIRQRKENSPPQNFETAQGDILSSGGLGSL